MPIKPGNTEKVDYTGILRSGKAELGIFPELQIIDTELYERAQEIMRKRTQPHSDLPLNTKGKALLAGKHCGSKLVLTTRGRCRNHNTEMLSEEQVQANDSMKKSA